MQKARAFLIAGIIPYAAFFYVSWRIAMGPLTVTAVVSIALLFVVQLGSLAIGYRLWKRETKSQ